MKKETKAAVVKKAVKKLTPVKKPPKRNRKWGATAPYSPSERDLAWYYTWAVDHCSYNKIAINAGVSRQVVNLAVRKVAEWLRLEMFDEIVEIRHRQTEMLENVISEELAEWVRSKMVGITITRETGGKNGDITKTQETHHTGNPAHHLAALAAAADIRKIWGVDKPMKLEVSGAGEGEGLERVCGLTPAEALVKQAAAMLERAKKLEESQ